MKREENRNRKNNKEKLNILEGSTKKIVFLIISTIILVCCIMAFFNAIKANEVSADSFIYNLNEVEYNELDIDSIKNENLENLEENLIEENKIDENTTSENTTNEKGTDKENNTKKQTVNLNTGDAPYKLEVNCTANVVNVYGKDANGNYTKFLKVMLCSTGSATPHSGTYKLKNYRGYGWRWRDLFGNVSGQYVTWIVGNILFHSVPYTSKASEGNPSSLEYWEYDKLGTSASMGCVRLTVKNAKWIYDNCQTGTLVKFYEDNNPGPQGKPTEEKISSNIECRNWDPTDPDPNNPWKTYKEKKEKENKEQLEKNKIVVDNNMNMITNNSTTNSDSKKDDETNTNETDEKQNKTVNLENEMGV